MFWLILFSNNKCFVFYFSYIQLLIEKLTELNLVLHIIIAQCPDPNPYLC